MPAFVSRFAVSISIALCLGAPAFGQEPAPQQAAAPVKPAGGVPAVRTVVRLRTSLTSKSIAQGATVEGVLDKATELSDGTRLPKGSILSGKVVQVSRHSKSLPNGAVMLTFDHVIVKGSDPIPVLVKMRTLDDPSQETNTRAGQRIGGTSNSGGGDQLAFEKTNLSSAAITGNTVSSHLKGVYLEANSMGSGVVYAAGEDVFVDSGILITVVMARTPTP